MLPCPVSKQLKGTDTFGCRVDLVQCFMAVCTFSGKLYFLLLFQIGLNVLANFKYCTIKLVKIVRILSFGKTASKQRFRNTKIVHYYKPNTFLL